jgi:type II secretory pathway component PulF
MSGKLDETLKRMQRLYQQDGSRQLQTVAEWTPRLIYFGIALAIAVQVISFYSGYFSGLGGL